MNGLVGSLRPVASRREAQGHGGALVSGCFGGDKDWHVLPTGTESVGCCPYLSNIELDIGGPLMHLNSGCRFIKRNGYAGYGQTACNMMQIS